MTNHSSRGLYYTAEIGGPKIRCCPKADFRTIRECRVWAEEYGDTADYCTITDAQGRVVGSHRRDRNGDGTRWFRATVWPLQPACTTPSRSR